MHCSRCGTWAADDLATCGTCGASLAPGAFAEPGPGVRPDVVAAPAALVYGGFWRRAVAFGLDWLVLFFPEAISRTLLGLEAFDSSSLWADPREWGLLVASGLLGLLYHSLLASSPVEGTLGQRALDLRMADSRGRRLTFARATGRWVLSVFSILTCGLGWLLMLWTPRRQTLHDLMAGTLVVRVGRETAPTAPDGRPVEAR